MGPLAVALLAFSCSSTGRLVKPARREGIEWFTDRARESGLDFVHFNGMTGAFHFPEVIPPGVALFDYDNDDDLDVFVPQGQMLGKRALSEALKQPQVPLEVASTATISRPRKPRAHAAIQRRDRCQRYRGSWLRHGRGNR